MSGEILYALLEGSRSHHNKLVVLERKNDTHAKDGVGLLYVIWVSWEIDNFNGVAVLLLSTECISF